MRLAAMLCEYDIRSVNIRFGEPPAPSGVPDLSTVSNDFGLKWDYAINQDRLALSSQNRTFSRWKTPVRRVAGPSDLRFQWGG